jgi:GTP:adenosylcobinamide-phosphate guanylyltransferase
MQRPLSSAVKTVAAPPVTALLVAGRRPGLDPLAQHFGVQDKALIAIAGEAMLSRVARTLVDHPAVARIVVLAQEPEDLLAAIPWMEGHPKISTRSGGASVSEAVANAIAAESQGFPFLLTTADNVLLDHAILDAFIADARDHDLAVGMVERRVLLSAYPGNRRTWLKFRGGAWSGANLFWLGDPKVAGVLALWRTIEQERKRGRAVIRAFGPLMLAAVGLRLLTLQQAIRIAGRRFRLDAAAVPLPFAEACIDVDSVADHQMAEAIIKQRETAPQ